MRTESKTRGVQGRQEEEGMLIRSCDGNLAAIYVLQERTIKLGRSTVNLIRSLEVSVENEHS